jgi:hypothetical protein
LNKQGEKMMMKTNYTNVATADNPALIIYLLDISRSMGTPMVGKKSRLEIVRDALKTTLEQMTQNSLRHGAIRPRYRIAMFAYSDDLYDILDGIKEIDAVATQGIPQLPHQKRTNTAKGFKYVRKILREDIKNWPNEWLQDCPAPMVIHMTDGKINEIMEDPEPIVNEIRSIQVPDGGVLIQNVHITDKIKVSSQDIQSWGGYQENDELGNEYANRLLKMSSLLPDNYRKNINIRQELDLQPGVKMMFPGINLEFVKQSFVINGVTGELGDQVPDDEEDWSEDRFD